MAKTNDFEKGKTSYNKMRFSAQANIHYRVNSVDDIDENKLSQLIQHHQEHQVPRLDTLESYFKGENVNILVNKRRREEHLADNRATHNFAKYVSKFIQGYMMGVPLKTSHEDNKVNKLLRDINRINDADEHNSELALDQSIFGRAYELLYRNHDDEIRFVQLPVQSTFIIYDSTVDMKPIAAVRYYEQQFTDEAFAELYTDSKITKYKLTDAREVKFMKDEPNNFGKLPIIEYQNDKYRQGDFEDVLSLIDLYDAAQSDTANYMQDLNDAMLVMKGNLEIDVEKAKQMKEKNILMLQTETDVDGRSSNADAYYIYKQYDVAGTEAYKDRLFNNILLFTSIPNLLDDKKGAGNQSGEALKMKLFALTQKRATKERLFKRGLRDRYRIIKAILEKASEGSFDVNDISITFTENLPSMIDKELEWFNAAGGVLSQETMLNNLSFVENAQEEMERIESESKLNELDPFDVYDEVTKDE